VVVLVLHNTEQLFDSDGVIAGSDDDGACSRQVTGELLTFNEELTGPSCRKRRLYVHC
jgi:hypothetical protein